jgi:tRNA nucleotidyltransferase (CCA-adding enzyme)
MDEPVAILLKHVLEDITPTEKDRKKEEAMLRDIMTILDAVSRGINPKVKPLMVGSIAKGTDLRDDKDFDIFIQFPKGTTRQQLEEQGLAIGRKFFDLVDSKYEISYAEHPYVKGEYHGFPTEIVPCYDLGKSKTIKSAVDRSPLHTKFVVDKLKKKSVLQDEIRLLKKFMKGNDIYGAHAAVEGFSGYLCELLVIKYGSFLNVLKAANDWKKHEHLSMDDKKNKKKFPDAPLVFIDPVDENRNVAAAVSVEKMASFMYLAEAFIEKPRKEFFYEDPKEPMSKKAFYQRIKVRGTELICIYFKTPKLVEDALVPQLSKSLRHLASECERQGFRIIKKGKWTDGKEAAFLLEFEVSTLPRVYKKNGPFFDSKVADLKGFIEANKTKAISKPYLEGDQWAIDVEREYRHADLFLEDYLEDPKGFGKNLREVKNFDIKINSDIQGIKNQDFWKYMSVF